MIKGATTCSAFLFFLIDNQQLIAMLVKTTTGGECKSLTNEKAAAVVRNQSLDALRGYAILTMVLSGSIAFGDVLPAWMFHAQVPPPDHKFIPTLPGITWVDLVFPFFLFSMGAAIPLSLQKEKTQKVSFIIIFLKAARRYALLTFFALFTYHMRAWVIAEVPDTSTYLYSIAAFVLLCFQFYEYKGERYKKLFIALKVIAFAFAGLLLYLLPFNKGTGFDLNRVDIIILVLANMAFFGTIIWWFTKNDRLIRVGLLAFVAAVFLGGKESGSWNELLFNFSPAPWMYKFYYLKYLFIIIPGTLAGEWLLSNRNSKSTHKHFEAPIALLTLLLILLNVTFLYLRMTLPNLFFSIAAALLIRFVVFQSQNELYKKFWRAGFYLLLLGLFLDAFEGGIKKDPSTYSYYFVTSGLAFFALIFFSALAQLRYVNRVVSYLSENGRNPMVAYVAGNLLLIPVLHLSSFYDEWSSMNTSPFVGFLKGFLFTAIVSLITVFFTRRKWFWKT
jgi:predicted acyltransferase